RLADDAAIGHRRDRHADASLGRVAATADSVVEQHRPRGGARPSELALVPGAESRVPPRGRGSRVRDLPAGHPARSERADRPRGSAHRDHPPPAPLLIAAPPARRRVPASPPLYEERAMSEDPAPIAAALAERGIVATVIRPRMPTPTVAAAAEALGVPE